MSDDLVEALWQHDHPAGVTPLRVGSALHEIYRDKIRAVLRAALPDIAAALKELRDAS